MIKNIFFISLIGLLLANNSFSQQDPVLFEYGPYKVKKSEFIDVYTKNNVTSSGDFSEASVRDYLDLYVKFKLKVQEAKDMKIDTLASIQKEFETYRTQLAKSYLVDKQITDKILKETYDRLQKEVNASHILVKVKPDATNEEKEDALSKIKKIKTRVEGGEDFAKVASEVSEDPSAKNNGGNLGYFTALQMVYPFESGAYNTAVGKVSNPVETRFGYHIIKVHDVRPARGRMQAAHIFIQLPKNPTADQEKQAKQKIDDIYSKLKDGEPFEKLARTYSEDKSNSSRGGELPWFGTGKMVPEFEDVAFSLQNDGDYSEPFKTQYGWHVVKRLKKQEVESFEDSRSALKRKVEKDSRSEITKQEFINNLKKEYEFKENSKSLAKLRAQVDETLLTGKWNFENPKKLKKPVFVLLDKKYTQLDFAQYLRSQQPKRSKGKKTVDEVFNAIYSDYVEKSISDFEESRLEMKYPEFKTLMAEYRDGILLFELIDRNVWSKAVKDTIGLKNFFEDHRKAFVWGNRVDVDMYTCFDDPTCNKVRDLLKKKTSEEIIADLNKDAEKEMVSVKNAKYEKDQNDLIDEIEWKKGFISKNLIDKNGETILINVLDLLEPQQKTLDEARGYAISDYQDQLEREWVDALRKKYPVTIHEEVVKSIIK